MSLLNDVQKFIEAHPGCTSGDIADAFAGYSRQRVLQSASKLRQSGRVAHRCEGDTRRHFPRLTEIPQEPEPQPVRESRPVRNFYVGTNDPRVILCLTRQAEELESRGLYRRAATVWMAAFRESHSQQERNNFLARRERFYGKAASALYRVKSGICQGITWGLNDDVNSMPAAGAGYADFLPERTWLPANQSGGGYHAGIPFSECSGGASSRTGEKRRHHDKAWRGPGHHASYRGEGRRQRGGRDYPRTACW